MIENYEIIEEGKRNTREHIYTVKMVWSICGKVNWIANTNKDVLSMRISRDKRNFKCNDCREMEQ